VQDGAKNIVIGGPEMTDQQIRFDDGASYEQMMRFGAGSLARYSLIG
jgi:hypothetical protein